MSNTMTIRPTTKDDIASIDALLAASYPVLLKPDYPPSILVTAIPIISHAQPRLLACGTYFGVFDADGQAIAAGGWTQAAPGGGQEVSRNGHIRHVVTDHRRTREGIGRLLMEHIFATARKAGITRLLCQSTLTAEPFYAAMGFVTQGPIQVPLRPGIDFPAIAMIRDL